MTCYLVCSPALYIVERYDTYKEALARLRYIGIAGYHIYEAKLMDTTNEKDVHRCSG